MPNLDEVLQHVGVRGMKWGVRRDRNRPGGADGIEESKKPQDTRSNTRKKLDSLKRERDWKMVLKNVDKLSTADINKVSKRIGLENDLKKLSKSVGKDKDKQDYLNRAKMSDSELNRKVVRLRAKQSLKEKVSDASKEQREFGEKVVQIATSVGVKYALKRQVGADYILEALEKPKETSAQAKKDFKEEGIKRLKAYGKKTY